MHNGRDMAESLERARAEGLKNFGSESVYLEKFIVEPRHVEVQLFGDTHGNIVHLFERDCSLQRRHQKVIEEAPAPGMDEATREQLCAAAVKAAKAVDYVGAGTIEFIADASEGLRADRIWFMEMNTRLQVEHPVTEEITGVDLVEWQLRVASGEPLPLRQDELSIDGHAIEARLYAEDPAKGFLPSVGRLEFFELDGSVRIDTGVCQGSEASPFYDPMIAKMIAHDLDREGAIQSLAWALNDSKIWPVKNNAAFLINALEHPDFASGNVDTGLIQRAGDALIPDESADIDDLARSAEQYTNQAIAGFRLNGDRNHKAVLSVDGVATEVDVPIVEYVDPRPFVFSQNAPSGFFQTGNGQTWWVEPYRYAGGAHASAHDGDILSPMPGRIIAVDVAAGQAVTKGQKLLTLEAMKMEHSLTAPFDGVVAELNAEAGAQVQVEALLARIEAVDEK